MFPTDDDGQGFPDPDDDAEFADVDEQETVDTIECWRCGKYFDMSLTRCSACDAPVRRQSAQVAKSKLSNPKDQRVLQVIVVFGLLFIPMLGCSASFLLAAQEPTAEDLLQVILTLEIIDTLIVLIALGMIRPPQLPDPPPSATRVAMWIGSIPLLALMLGLNVAYFRILIEGFGIPVFEDQLMNADRLLPWVILTIGIQPAIVEEIFFRQTALLTMRETMSETAAIWTTGVMFGFAHVGNPLGIPYLMLFGVFLGYVRVKSGSLVLPMILHFLHNMAVLYIERM